MRRCEVEKMAYDFLNDFCCFLFFCCFGICFAICLRIGEIFSKVCIGFGAENTFFYYTRCCMFDFMFFEPKWFEPRCRV